MILRHSTSIHYFNLVLHLNLIYQPKIFTMNHKVLLAIGLLALVAAHVDAREVSRTAVKYKPKATPPPATKVEGTTLEPPKAVMPEYLKPTEGPPLPEDNIEELQPVEVVEEELEDPPLDENIELPTNPPYEEPEFNFDEIVEFPEDEH
ncbi:unnamed protein product [Orchesella dallaii]|uniref:Uncharacterized protein n=1 Tax=Orchesella dallaii TaxID=48710 RepID=A0ABP1S7S9_9HEXA